MRGERKARLACDGIREKTIRPRSYHLLSLHSNEFKRSSPQLSGRAAPEAAKKKKTAKQASLQSEIIIGGRQGRETWECCKLINQYGVPRWTLPLMDTNCGSLSWESTSTDSIKHIKGTNSTLIFPGFFYCSVQINHI